MSAVAQQPGDTTRKEHERKQKRNGSAVKEIAFYRLKGNTVNRYAYTKRKGMPVSFSRGWTEGNASHTIQTYQSFQLDKKGRLDYAYERIIDIYNKKDSTI